MAGNDPTSGAAQGRADPQSGQDPAQSRAAPVARFLDPSGQALKPLPDFAGDRAALVAMYTAMVTTRAFDAKAIALQRTGRLGTYASSLGQEAVAVGTACAMRAEDVFLPSFREHGAQLVRGVTLDELFLYWGGDERGNDYQGPRRDFPVCIPVASQFPHAAGVALAMVQKGEAGVAVAVGGDGATSKGDFYEAMNLVGAWRLPAVFVINNNQWAISVRRRDQTAAQTLAQKAVAAGIPGVQVDGNDVIAVRDAVGHALARARAGGGGALIECQSYRLGDHTTADDARRYRDDEEVRPHWKEDPVARLRTHLTEAQGWTKDEEEALLHDARAEVEAAAERYIATGPAPARAMFESLFADMPEDLKAQAKDAGHG
ncbi:pyruvate dehydrogenase (acetyl-transferring) E1 component subunit alpha [Aestuariicoccus sp. MJ-SS9]|uniref:pyruvate dehydrogenase (acetyl-transferring) E1 component subunit alpha n=1 Tax=Aestuariicoccus sp. MJ-SS9 TaxID=3079855 RepID=UPI00290E2322|nr:pyruvate dehydrogenase (acetyl-transferring) E1 component subunit alpha [Aestuariicoccus sp. MJ-SS9]MDU8911644.1 pyruvate dehydrogenase (acetyl-transferring) E1 component subunit alpha [Aestuariicoccus sp. MJ-SS9]